MTDFSSLYQKYAQDVFCFAYFLSGNEADAEDITSNTFMHAWAAPRGNPAIDRESLASGDRTELLSARPSAQGTAVAAGKGCFRSRAGDAPLS
jgi:hypothetical protein